DGRAGTELRGEFTSERVPRAAPCPRHEQERLLLARRRKSIELMDQIADRFIPADVREFAAAARAGPLFRPGQPVGMIRDLNRGLAAGAHAPVADRIARWRS